MLSRVCTLAIAASPLPSAPVMPADESHLETLARSLTETREAWRVHCVVTISPEQDRSRGCTTEPSQKLVRCSRSFLLVEASTFSVTEWA